LIWLVGLLHGFAVPEPIVQDSAAAKLEEVRGERRGGSQGWDLPDWASGALKVLHKSLPRTKELGKLTTQLLSRDLLSEAERKAEGLERPLRTSWLECISVSTAWIVLLLGAACWL